MPLNKIQIKALVFSYIDPLRNVSALDEDIVNSVSKNLRQIKDADFEFISRLLIKEANPDNQKFATALLFIAESLSPETFLTLALNELNSQNVQDSKKIFLMNILSSFGVAFQPEDISLYLKNPDDAINCETSRFLEVAQIDPEAQIDFLDFYFASPIEDKKGLVESVCADFDGDRLVNILSPLALSAYEPEIVDYCLDIIEKTKSILSYKPYFYLSHSKNEKIKKRCVKNLRKLSLSGIYTKEKSLEYYKDLLSDFEEPIVRMSLPDGNSNFSAVVSRKTKDNAYYLFFIAVNIRLGPFSCFGFSSLTKQDHDSVLNRFVNETSQIKIPNGIFKRILDELAVKRIEANKTVPYEYYCWERILDDIEIREGDIFDILHNGLSCVSKEDLIKKEEFIISSPFVQNWFFRYSKNNPSFSNFLDKVMELQNDNFSLIDTYLVECSKSVEIIDMIKTRISYLAFCLKTAKMDESANIYYSLLFDEEEFSKFLIHILKRSLYEHLLYLNLPEKKSELFNGLSLKTNSKQILSLLKYVENNWVEK